MTATSPSMPLGMTGLTAVLHREYRLLTRNRTNLMLAMIPTAVYLLLFATSLTNLIGSVEYHGHRVSYSQFMIPSMMLFSMLAASTTSATALFQEKLGGMDVELWSYPLRRSSYVAGKLAATTALVLVQTVAALVVALAVFRVGWGVEQWAALLVGTVVASFALNGLYLLLATLLSDFQRFSVVINVLAPVLLFASPSFYPASTMPVVLRVLSWANPVTYATRALRDGALFGFGSAWPWLAVLSGLAIASMLLIGRALLVRARNV